jgi:mannosyltransferase OCH1-like enzyme
MIPKLIHKVLIVDDGKIPALPDGMKKAFETWYRMNPEYKIKIYSGDDCVAYIKEHFDESVLDAYNALKPYSYKCDLMRHLILYNEGGWYTDARMICYEPLDTLTSMHREFYACIDTPQRQLCMTTGFIGSIPKHQISKKMIDILLWNVTHKHYGMDCLAPTGPGAYINACVDHIRKFPGRCLIGKHVIENGEQFIDFDCGRIAKVKYNNAKGADNNDITGGNDYGEMWRNWDIYLT